MDAFAKYKNVATIDDYGFNAALEGSALEGRLRYGAQLTAAHARRDDGDGPKLLTVGPQLFGNARVSYDLTGNLPVLGLAAPRVNEFKPIYAPEHIEQMRTFTSVLTLTFRVIE